MHPISRRLDEACRRHGVLLLQGLLHQRQRQAQGCRLGIGQLDPDLLILQTDQLDLADILDPLQLQLHTVGIVLEYRIVEAFAGQGIDVAEGGAELVIEERPLDTWRQAVTNVRDLFANLVPQLGNILGAQRVTGDEGDLRLAGARKGHDLVVLAGFHELLLDALGHLPRHFLSRRPRPQGAHHHGLEGKGGIFALAQLAVGDRPDHRQQNH